MGLPQLHIVLPERLQRFVPSARRGLAFGIPALDALLPLGLPRGQIAAFDAPLGQGGTALLLALAEATLRSDEGVAFVDAARTLAPQAAAHLAELGPFWVIRPRGTESAWWCADILLRTGAFGLVVVDQAPAPSRPVAVRLQRLARDKDAVLVLRGHGGTGARGHGDTAAAPAFGAALVISVRASAAGFLPAAPGAGAAWPGIRRIRVMIEKGGAPRAAEVPVGAPLPHRLRPHWAVRDRRGEPAAGQRSRSGRGQSPRAGQPDWPERRAR